MRPHLAALAAAALLLLCWGARSEADFYKWTDEHGQIHLTDDYYKVPPKYRGKAEVKKPGGGSATATEMPPLGGEQEQTPTPPTSAEPTLPTGEGGAPVWKDFNGRGSDYWTSRQHDLQMKSKDLERRLEENKGAISGLRSTRAAYIGGRRQRGQLETENKELEMQLKDVQGMLKSGLADEALRSGVPADFANSLRGM